MNRRGFLRGVSAALFCAPAIVRVGSIMPVKAIRWTEEIFTVRVEWGEDAFLMSVLNMEANSLLKKALQDFEYKWVKDMYLMDTSPIKFQRALPFVAMSTPLITTGGNYGTGQTQQG